ncbi:hypothetical protein [Streptomyces longwoodensis]|uniref:hypothetical protein n=1 Tax=Streptomyces longwoodensis TaxID=68231 RepID=UPI0033E32AE8
MSEQPTARRDSPHAMGERSVAAGNIGMAITGDNARLFMLSTQAAQQADGGSPPPSLANLSNSVSGLFDPPVRSNYASQVRRIAPEKLVGREYELGYLADYCTSPTSEPYLWWRAGAWAGKSALLSSFALNPPAGVRTVSFFITARLAGQADRRAFSDVVLEQLLEIIGESMPPLLTDATREAHLLGALDRAAKICHEAGERLVLIVDGLDEDQGVTVGPDAHSIAALLPSSLPADMRVIVSSRPNPPLPSDVPDDHPLRQRVTVCQLQTSPHAEVVRQDAERELKRLLHGSTTELDLLGFLTTAGGGLTEEDLSELTDLSAWEIESHLSAVSGRTFMSRSGRWRAGTVYMLGHEELQQQAAKFLGVKRLEVYRQELNSWADGYRARHWPSDTPEYLLQGYFKLLQASGDKERMLACATDPDRHDRMLDIIGGDTSAIGEITTTQDFFVNQPNPDLLALSRLSIHRTRLSERNDAIPVNLPGVWAQVGRPSRAEALARSITVPFRRVQALAAVAREVAAAGILTQAKRISIQAEKALDDISDEYERAQGLAVVARATGEAGDSSHARALIKHAELATNALTDVPRQGQVLVSIARATAAAGNVHRASEIADKISTWSECALALMAISIESANAGDLAYSRRIANSIRSRSERAQALAAIARAEDFGGNHRKAVKTLDTAEVTARAIRNPSRKAWTLASVALAASSIGRFSKAAEILNDAEQLVSLIGRSSDRDDILNALARGAAMAKDPDRAEAITRQVKGASRRLKAFAALASALASAGYGNKAIDLAKETEEEARKVSSPSQTVKGLALLSQAAAAVGAIDHAEKVAWSISDLPQRERTLTVVAEAVARSGDIDHAAEIAASMEKESQQDKAFSIIASVAAGAGELEQAKKVAASIRDPTTKQKTLTKLSAPRANTVTSPKRVDGNGSTSHAGIRKDHPKEVRDALTSRDFRAAEEISAAINEPYDQFKAIVATSHAIAEAGDIERAVQCAGSIRNTPLRVKALASLGQALIDLGHQETAERVFNQAVAISDAIASPTYRNQLTAQIAQQLADTGNLNRAEAIVHSMLESPAQQKALSAVAVSAAASGSIDRALRIAGAISESRKKARTLLSIAQASANQDDPEKAEVIARSINLPVLQAQALGVVVQSFASSGQVDRAEEVAHSIAYLPEQARVLSQLASNLSSTDSRRLVGQALTIGHWQICLAAAIRIEPGVVSVMAEEFLRTRDPATA